MNKFYFFILLMASLQSFSQKNKLEEYQWSNKGIYEVVPDSFSNADAVMIFENNYLNLSFASEGPQVQIKIWRKIKILTQQGVDQYSKIYLPKYDGQTITKMDARTIKKNGDVVDLSAKDIKYMDIAPDDFPFLNMEYMFFAVPGAEVGDQIEIFYSVVARGLITSNDVYLHSYLPVISSSYSLKILKGIKTVIQPHNGMPEPNIINEREEVSYTWKLKFLPSIQDQEFSIPSREIPYVSFVIREISFDKRQHIPIEANNWVSYVESVIYNTEAQNSSSARWVNYLDDFFDSRIGPNSGKTLLQKMSTIQSFIADSIEETLLSEDITLEGTGYHLDKKKMDLRNLRIFYGKLFRYLDLDYYVGLARNRYDGDIDMKFIYWQGVSDLFFAFEYENNYYFMFTKDPKTSYEFGEIPYEYQNSLAILIPRKYIKTKNADEEIKTVKLPASPKNMNYRRMKTVLYISHQDSVLKGSCKEIFSGAVSTECRQKFIRDPNGSISEKIKLLKNSKSNNNLVLDSLVIDKQHSYPYNFNLNYKCALANSVTWPEKDLYSLALTGWLDHFQEEASKKRRFLGYYTKYQYTDDIKYYLVFDTPVEVVNSNQTEIKLKNNFGSYTFSLKQINDNTVLINSNYDIDNLYLPEKDYDQFRELSLASLKAEATQLFIKIKK